MKLEIILKTNEKKLIATASTAKIPKNVNEPVPPSTPAVQKILVILSKILTIKDNIEVQTSVNADNISFHSSLFNFPCY